MFLSTALSPTLVRVEVRTENLALELFTLGVRMPDIKKTASQQIWLLLSTGMSGVSSSR